MLYQLIEISGNDAEEFLQGQLTQDVARIASEISLPAAWCNAKGRVITMIRLLQRDNGFGLAVPDSLVDLVMKRLAMYRLRADVNIARADDDWRCLAVGTMDAFAQLDRAGLLPEANKSRASDGLIAVDHSAADRFVEIFGNLDAIAKLGLAAEAVLSDSEHAAQKIRAGIAEIDSQNTEKYTPHMLNLDRLGAINFDKGCYTGQEVVARTEHLGVSKRRLMRYRCDASDIRVGDKLSDGAREVGTVVNVEGNELLAVTPVALHAQSLLIGSSTATPLN